MLFFSVVNLLEIWFHIWNDNMKKFVPSILKLVCVDITVPTGEAVLGTNDGLYNPGLVLPTIIITQNWLLVWPLLSTATTQNGWRPNIEKMLL